MNNNQKLEAEHDKDCGNELEQHIIIFHQFTCSKCGYEAFIRAEKSIP